MPELTRDDKKAAFVNVLVQRLLIPQDPIHQDQFLALLDEYVAHVADGVEPASYTFKPFDSTLIPAGQLAGSETLYPTRNSKEIPAVAPAEVDAHLLGTPSGPVENVNDNPALDIIKNPDGSERQPDSSEAGKIDYSAESNTFVAAPVGE